ncbi:DoxX family protein [Streptomyces niger]|uniref:DoxX family protein n=1 Tax=Streptomyces niger TaxID=66373 RepID=UPI000699CD29|nr:DoxX family protein [Streptomyces niger]
MLLLRLLARPMLASTYVFAGYQTFRNPAPLVPAAEPVVQPIAQRVPGLPQETEQLVKLSGGVQLVAGSLLAIGKLPRLSALAIAATLVPTTLAGHRFWEAEDEQTRGQERIQFLKNLSMLGGLLIAGADTHGKPSLAWQGRHAAHQARREAALRARTARRTHKVSSRLPVG